MEIRKCLLRYNSLTVVMVVIESQTPRVVEDGRNFWRSWSPTYLLKQYHVESVAQNHVQIVF